MLKLFYRAKRLKHEKQNNTLPFYTALLSMVLCMVCLAGTTWAWFTATQLVEVESITSAEWAIESVEVYQIASAGNAERIMIPVDETETGVEFDVDADTKYAVAVSTRGNSSTGYLYVETCDGNYYTTKSDVDFELFLSESGTVTITASWGGYSGLANQLSNGECIGNGEIPVCECNTICTGESANGDCRVCSKDHSLCLGETAECTCENKCTEPNDSCEVCKSGVGGCTGKEEETTTEETTADETGASDETTPSDETEPTSDTEPESPVATETPIESETSAIAVTESEETVTSDELEDEQTQESQSEENETE